MKRVHLGVTLAASWLCIACSGESVGGLPAPSRDGWAPESAWPGFTLVAPDSHVVRLVDMSGTAVHQWASEDYPGALYLTERGTLLCTLEGDGYPVFGSRGGASGGIEELDWDGTRLWLFRWASERGMSHHDIAELPNGNMLFIAWDRKSREEALAAGRDPELLGEGELWPDAVYEVRPTRPEGGEIVWSWHSWDHLVQDFDPSAPNFADPATRPERIDVNGDRDLRQKTPDEEAAVDARLAALGYAGDVSAADVKAADEGVPDEKEEAERAAKAAARSADWMHSNGIDYNAELDQIAISVRRYDEVWIIDHSTTSAEAASSSGGRSGKGGDLLYRWGNPFAYGMGEWEERPLLGQHNVQWIPAGRLGAGNLLVYDNGTDDDRPWSMIREWWAPRDAEGNYLRAEGEPFGPSEMEWSYTAPEPEDFYSDFISGVQRLPNGNTLICCGAPGWVFEVTPAGRMVWDWRNPYTKDPEFDEIEEEDEPSKFPFRLFRAERYGPDHPGIVALRTKGAPVPMDPGSGPATNNRPAEEDSED